MRWAIRLTVVFHVTPLLLIGVARASPHESTHPTKTTVCQIVSHPNRFDGKAVGFEASVESDGIERTVLLSSACSNRGITLAT
jgi:hypothetical protein